MKFKEKLGEDGNVFALGIESNDLFQLGFFNDLYDVCEKIEKIDGVERILSITKAYSIQKMIAWENWNSGAFQSPAYHPS
jgi:hypothetical protein